MTKFYIHKQKQFDLHKLRGLTGQCIISFEHEVLLTSGSSPKLSPEGFSSVDVFFIYKGRSGPSIKLKNRALALCQCCGRIRVQRIVVARENQKLRDLCLSEAPCDCESLPARRCEVGCLICRSMMMIRKTDIRRCNLTLC